MLTLFAILFLLGVIVYGVLRFICTGVFLAKSVAEDMRREPDKIQERDKTLSTMQKDFEEHERRRKEREAEAAFIEERRKRHK